MYSIIQVKSLPLRKSQHVDATDLVYSFTLPKQTHIITLYNFSGSVSGSYIIMRFRIDSRPQAHNVSITGNTKYAGNF